jgi:hypothetical protein
VEVVEVSEAGGRGSVGIPCGQVQYCPASLFGIEKSTSLIDIPHDFQDKKDILESNSQDENALDKVDPLHHC